MDRLVCIMKKIRAGLSILLFLFNGLIFSTVFLSFTSRAQSPSAPEINRISPKIAVIKDNLTITGNYFGLSKGAVLFNSLAADSILSWYETTIRLVVPIGAHNGFLKVKNADTGLEGAYPLSVKPYIINISAKPLFPRSSVSSDTLVISGCSFGDFTEECTVTFTLVIPAKTIVSWNDTTVVVIVPSGAQTGMMGLSNPKGDSNYVWYKKPLVPSNSGIVRLTIRDVDTGEILPCRVTLADSAGNFWGPEGMQPKNRSFFYCLGDTSMFLSKGRYYASIFRGNEYIPMQNKPIDVPEYSQQIFTIDLTLKRWIHLKQMGWYSCDSHVHSQGSITPEGAYYVQLGEDLNILQLDALGEGNWTADYQYFANKPYSFSLPFYLFTYGEEWRSRSWQNHMITLNCQRPLSAYGNGYYDVANCKYAYSYPPALDFLDEAHQMGGIVVAGHPFPFSQPWTVDPASGADRHTAYELPVDVALGKIDGMEVYIYSQGDTWTRYVWYKLLNCGFRVPPFVGSDVLNFTSNLSSYFFPGIVRHYVYVPNQTQQLGFSDWIREAVKGRSFVSTGAALFFTVNGEMPGSELSLKSVNGTAKVTVRADARWMGGIKTIYILVNGETVSSQSYGGSTEAVLSTEIALSRSSWIAARVEGNSAGRFYGNAHSAPVYVTVDGKPIRSRSDALYFVNWIDKHIALLDSANHFDTVEHKKRTFDLYRKGQDVFRARADTTYTTAVDSPRPSQFALYPNVPNPFNPSTVVSFELPERGRVSLEIYDILGQRVKILFAGELERGIHRLSVSLAGKSSGLYFLRLTSSHGTLTRKMLFLQ
ncbi:MAG: CehA/McbA family metallohydrolase [Candidatus Latescibacter sp.]|nr:CehA/McbA family metallohydrolase [Candidatus Latescibacter sp.]